MTNLELLAKGSSSSSSSRSSSTSSSSTSKSTPPKTSTPAPSQSKPGKSTATPGSKVKTADGQEVQSSTKKPTNTKYTSSKGIVGDNGYTPRFNNGYSAPPGSVVYYPQHSFIDYLPWIYLFSQDSPSHDQATIVQPDGKEVQAQPVQEGIDGMAIFNWFLLIVIALGIIGGVMYGVYKWTTQEKS